MFGKNKKPLIVTHNSGFHTDDVFAVATLRIIFGEIEIIRTRDEEIIERADYVVDLGHIYDPDKNRFDHHQTEGAGKRGNGIPYASFGLVWKKFGPDLSESDYVFEKFDQEIVQAIDASDNGFDVSRPIVEGVENFSIGQIIGLFQPTWKETKKDIDKSFSEAVLWAEEIIKRKIKVLKDEDEATRIILNKYEQAPDKRLIILDEKDSFGRYIITKVLSALEEPLFVVFPRPDTGAWQVVALNQNPNTYVVRKKFSENWLGLRNEELSKVSGVEDAIFCHRNGFMSLAKSKEGAIKLAKLALEA